MAVVSPKTDCPHLGEHLNESLPDTLGVKGGTCVSCCTPTENWTCLKCFSINCSRHISGHAMKHYEDSHHCLAASFSDLSIWCYECDSYITSPKLKPLLNQLHIEKFKKPIDGKGGENENSSIEEDEALLQIFKMLNFNPKSIPEPDPETSLKSVDVLGITDAIKSGKCKNIIVMTGAGISVSCGIPDFRTPGTGLYDNLQKYGLPHPTAVFEIDFFKKNPKPFCLLSKELFPGNFTPSPAHHFIKLLEEKGLLLRNFTQNIDTLERVAKISSEKLVEAHGSFASAHCVECKAENDTTLVKEAIFSDSIPKCAKCNSGIVKPDIVFFGEDLPDRFYEKIAQDFPLCDLLIVMGTSLKVEPFASLVHKVSAKCPRLLINREEVGKANEALMNMGYAPGGFRFGMKNNYRDVAMLGEIDEQIWDFAKALGWEDELNSLTKK